MKSDDRLRYMWLKVVAEESTEDGNFFEVHIAKKKLRAHKTLLREYGYCKSQYYEIRPCPFCGGEAELVKSGSDDSSYVVVQCNECKARGKGFYVGSELKGCCDPEKSIMAESAVKAWNKRVQLV